MKPMNQNMRRARSGFTLVEILVVLVIASILAAVTLGGYSAMRASNRLTSCQGNMVQIYHSIRLYAADYNGQAPYYDPDNDLGNGTGIGLWALYTYASDSDHNLPADANIKPEKRYLSNPKLFHCPSDTKGDDNQMFTDSTNSVYNLNYLSYQAKDYGCRDPKDSTCSGADSYPDNPDTAVTDHYRYTYDSVHTTTLGSNWQRQLLTYNGSVYVQRPPTDDTVVLWCPFHRDGGSGSSDNVLFWDGTIQNLPVNQGDSSSPVIGAGRTPKIP